MYIKWVAENKICFVNLQEEETRQKKSFQLHWLLASKKEALLHLQAFTSSVDISLQHMLTLLTKITDINKRWSDTSVGFYLN